MVLVAATAASFAIYRQTMSAPGSFTTFGGRWEPWVFYWMHMVVAFPAMWSLAVVAIVAFDRRVASPRRRFRSAGVVACCASAIATTTATLISSTFYLLHALEEIGTIPRIFSHPRGSHGLPPFAGVPIEEFIGAAVLGAWSALAATRRWRAEPTWIDRAGRALGAFWIVLFLLYIYAYSG
jgi:hypothetical protein